MKVLVCGGGISGLIFGIAMGKNPNVSVEIYEAAPEFLPIGAGIGIWIRVWEIMEKLGLAEALKSKTASATTPDPIDALIFRKSDQPEGLEFGTLVTNGPFITFHRHDFQQTLINHLPPSCKMHHSKRLSTYTTLPNGKIRASFEDGTQVTCDLLIGADGIKSTVRDNMLRQKAARYAEAGDFEAAYRCLKANQPVWAGTMAYRGLIPMEKVQKDLAKGNLTLEECHIQHMGKNANLIVYPIANGTMVNFAAFYHQPDKVGTVFEGPWVANVSNDELKAAYAGWEPSVQSWLKFVENPSRWAIHTIEKLDSYVADGVVLVGDAAHAMVPHQGSGAGQGIEDGYFLATLLSNPSITARDIPKVLAVYDAVRRPFSLEVCRRSHLNGSYYTMNNPDFKYRLAEALPGTPEQEKILKELAGAIKSNWEWAWTTSFNDNMEAGLVMLKKMMANPGAYSELGGVSAVL
ncbi:salicylate 1-monooxygenase [Coprinopsis cinerea okayama7|uniref:Salicylate 1-monooxygenase n=1 Tax=Coprinopsis cinerea (strain Okayama-7 / 130 / ATCC MYA-4618 / FGSC 9003) TaxID=240176 RepID=A8NLG4_COPC7|nr:salicylate 1-monooxygenase [Coprinopsis cinerea okayama7\|eukprot:XP_001834680.2 salicylate 1-monooxygenase [Coprinopsis cinerea okayama7\